ncbi:cytoplasmic dynein 2 intermediate chain 2-like [Halichondria panicea]|uniref:cytoplasmic dynein 2 intermediate chain 2-like n=1 Tax=Halichondria panicea TaxID=6063 RepID=UPI00312B38F2
MFQDEVLNPVDIDSCWKKEKSSREISSQTSETLTNDSSVQTSEAQEVGVQTDEVKSKPLPLVVDDSQGLKDFLRRVEPLVTQQLQISNRSHAFDGYKVFWEEESKAVSCKHTLTEASLNNEYNCTGLSWNCSGSVLAVAYGKLDHQDWCSHKSYLCTWNLDRRSLDPSKADLSIDVPSCLMCVAFHPEHPALVAGGTFNGEVRIWNTSLEGDPLTASSGLSDLGHKEPIAELSWILDEESRERRHLLLSLGNDGKVLVWACEEGVRVVRACRLLTESIPRSLRVSRAKGSTEVGGTCLSFSSEDKSLFVVGSENGGLFKCSMQASVSIGDTPIIESDLQSPIQFVFRPHHGPVYAISCSPFHRNLFLSCGTDGTARLYSQLDASPVLSIEPGCGYLFSVRWSVTRPLVFAVGTGDGQLLIYDLKSSHIKPCVSLEASPQKKAVYSVAYNHKRPQFLASGDACGVVKVWRLSTQLTAVASNEVEQLNSLATDTVAASTGTL